MESCIQGYIMATDLRRITHKVQAYFMVHMDNIRAETIASSSNARSLGFRRPSTACPPAEIRISSRLLGAARKHT